MDREWPNSWGTVHKKEIFSALNNYKSLKMRKTILKTQFIGSLLMTMAVLSDSLQAQTNQSKLLPSEALVLMYNAVDLNPGKERIKNTKPFQARVITEGLEGDEIFLLGETYFWNYMPKEADEIYTKFLDEDTDRGRAAWQRHLQVQFRAFDKHDFVEEQIKVYRKKFKPIPEDRSGIFGQVYNLANKYKQAGEHEKVVQLIKDEIDYLNYDGAYSSFQLPGIFFESFIKLGKANEAGQMIKNAVQGLQKTLDARKGKALENDFAYVVHSRPVRIMDNVMTEKLSYQQMTEKFEGLIKSLSRTK